MSGKIRIRLTLADGTQARSLEELRAHFDLESVLEHYQDGKLLKWLRGLYSEVEADAVEALDENAPDFQKKLCEVLGVEYPGDEVDLEAIQRRKERLDRLRAVTDEPEHIAHIDQVAFDQEELADLLDDGVTTIYLCGGSDEIFQLPASVHDVYYIGIGMPEAHINGKITETPEELACRIIGCRVDNMPGPNDEDDADEVVEDVGDNEDVKAEASIVGYSGKGPKPEDLMEYGGIEALPLSGWECDCPAEGITALYAFSIIFIGMVDKDKRIKSINQIWCPARPGMTIEDLTDEELAFIKNPSTDVRILRTATMAIAEENALLNYRDMYDMCVRDGMLRNPESFNYPLKWRAVRKTGEKIWDR